MPAKERIEPSKAGKSAGEGHIGDWQRRIDQELFSQEQPPRLGDLDRRDTELMPHCPTQMPRAGSQFPGQIFEPLSVAERTGINACHCAPRQTRNRIDRRQPRSEFRPATETRPESLAFRQRCGRKEPAAVGSRRPGRADRPAINARGRHPHKEQAVEASVARGQSPIANVIVEEHGPSVPAVRSNVWPFSDVTTGILRFGVRSRPGPVQRRARRVRLMKETAPGNRNRRCAF